MQLAQILTPKENVVYVINKFKESLISTLEEIQENESLQKAFSTQIDKFINPKNPDAFGFIFYLTGDEFDKYLQQLKPKGTKKKPLSIERINMIVMAIVQYFETQKMNEFGMVSQSIDLWLNKIQNLKFLSLNFQFEQVLNIYLVLSNKTLLKSKVFIELVAFLHRHNQLKQVMIKQVQDIQKLTEDWNLTRNERFELYSYCAEILMEEEDFTGSFNIYLETAKLIDIKNKVQEPQRKKNGENIILMAIKSPKVVNFEEIMMLNFVQEIKQTAKSLFDLLQVFLEKEISQFKIQIKEMSNLLEEKKISSEQALLKKQYIQICSLPDVAQNEEKSLSFIQIGELLGIDSNEIEEWIVEAMSNGIIDAKIDQINQVIIIKTSVLRVLDKEQWKTIKQKVTQWKQRFERVQNILEHQS